ncbi:hypothetical protein AB833_25450 [Chromatiales bacterium (ex Bugula neritina AB1)]|nr:hypothetical protein AB833_25450 [Chromatiales bacterium (ex Bugula neritina AB1)]
MNTNRWLHTHEFRSAIDSALSTFDRRTHSDDKLRRAAVALTISALPKTTAQSGSCSEACLLLTLRNSGMRRHAGQFALPGGKVDEGETLQQACLRELSEEIGLELPEGNILGRLDDFPTRSGFVISPFVVWNDTQEQPTANPDEVARIYQIPLLELAADNVAAIEEGPEGNPFLSIFPPSVNTRVYSPTAALIYQFREVVLLGNTTRVAHFEQPAFAWR